MTYFNPDLAQKDHQKFSCRVQELVQKYETIWWTAQDAEPGLIQSYTFPEKFKNEASLNRFLGILTAELESIPTDEGGRQALKQRMVSAFNDLLVDAFDFQRAEVEALLTTGFTEVAVDFGQMAQRFDPDITYEDIYQAARNVWTMNFLQLMLGKPVTLTPAIFAYSMLYPYTDNYLDDESISSATKKSFNDRFRQRLEGEPTQPVNSHEKRIWDLVAMVEEEYQRDTYPAVFDSLLAIQDAQVKSLALLKHRASPYEIDVLGISLEKGGTAVLADGYLVAGALTPEQEEFMFGYGAFTQLMDDQEDVSNDLKNGLMTVFSQSSAGWRLDPVAERTFRFATIILNKLYVFTAKGIDPFKTMMRRSINLLLIDAIGRTSQYYSRRYCIEIQRYLPVRFSYLREVRKRLTRQQDPLERMVRALVG